MTKTGSAAQPPLDLAPESVTDTLQRYQRPIGIGAVLLAVGIGGFYFMQRSAQIKESRGMEALLTAEGAYNSGDNARAREELGKVATRYAGTAAGTQAAQLAAQMAFEDGDAAGGITLLDQALRKVPAQQKPGLLALRAAGKATLGQPAEAAKDYESAASAAEFRQEREMYRMEAARQHVEAGNFAAARALYAEIAKREDSTHATEARLRLGELTLKG